MTKKTKKGLKLFGGLLLLVVLLVACNAASKLGEEDSETDADTTDEVTILDIDTSTITSFSFTNGDETLSFVLEDEVWYYDADRNFPVLQDSINTMLENMGTVTAADELKDVEDLAEYGLDSPAQLITITTEDGEVISLNIGDLNVSTSNYYACLNDDTTSVYTISSAIPSAFGIALYDLVDTEDFPSIDTGAIYYLAVEQEDSKIEFTGVSGEAESSNWKIKKNEDEAKSADTTSVESLFSNAGNLAFDSCVEYDAKNLSQYGLDQPSATITMQYTVEYEAVVEDSDSESEETDTSETETITVEKEVILLIGNQLVEEAADETSEDIISYYVQVEGSNEVHTMSATYLEPFLNIAVEDYYDTYVSYYSMSSLSKIVVTYDSNVYELTTNTVIETTTETNEDGEEEESEITTTYYYVNGEEVTSETFTSFFNAAVGIKIESYATEEITLEGEPVITLEFHIEDEILVVEYFAYDANFYAVETKQGIGFVNKLDVTSIITALSLIHI